MRETAAEDVGWGRVPVTFSLSVDDLASLHAPKSLKVFCAVGGLRGLEEGLRTDLTDGLAELVAVPEDPVGGGTAALTVVAAAERRRVFGDNHLPAKKQPTFPELVWGAYNDPVIILLTVAAAVSLAVGLYQTFGTPRTPDNPGVEWVEGVAILLAIVIIVLVGSVNDWEKQRQFQKLNRKQLQRDVKAVRSGATRLVPISEVLVGDVLPLEPGDVAPADGVLISGYNVVCDESAATGESDPIHKDPGDLVFRMVIDHGASEPDVSKLDPFILSGTQILEGVGTFLVTATGTDSTYGKILASLRDEPEPTPLQERLATLAKHISRAGAAAAVVLFLVLLIKFCATLPHNDADPSDKGKTFVDIVIIALTVLVIAVPEGLPLAVTLSLAFATTRMLRDKNLVRRLKSCEIMGNATTICSDKTGTLTQNRLQVAAVVVGMREEQQLQELTPVFSTAPVMDNLEIKSRIPSSLPAATRDLIVRSVALNTTAFEQDGGLFMGSRTETALLDYARSNLGMGPVKLERSSYRVVHVIPFNARRKCMATVVELPGSSKARYRVFVKGAAEILLATCTKIAGEADCGPVDLQIDTRKRIEGIIASYGKRSLRNITLAFRDFNPPSSLESQEDQTGVTDLALDYLLRDLCFLALLGIRDPLRPGVPQAVTTCQRAGITVRMVTGDNVETARAVARQCGILPLPLLLPLPLPLPPLSSENSNGDVVSPPEVPENALMAVVEGPRFARMTDAAVDALLPSLRVLARSSPEDKRRLVSRLRQAGEIVAVTGDGTNDAAALVAADVGFAMGGAGGAGGTEVAREASDIVLLDDDFSSVVTAVAWGRAVGDSVKRFLQFQITVTLTSVGLTFVSAVASAGGQSVLTAVQLMWVNLFQDTLAALALATDPPSPRVLAAGRMPEPRSAPLIATPMWKNIIGQSAYQLAVTLVLYFSGQRILRLGAAELAQQQLQTLVFNTYVWMQIFNMYNNRQHDNTLNVFEGVLRNRLLLAVSTAMAALQVLIVFVGGAAFSVVQPTGPQWAVAVVLGFLTLPVGVLIRLVPDTPLEEAARRVGRLVGRVRVLRRRERRVAGGGGGGAGGAGAAVEV